MVASLHGSELKIVQLIGLNLGSRGLKGGGKMGQFGHNAINDFSKSLKDILVERLSIKIIQIMKKA